MPSGPERCDQHLLVPGGGDAVDDEAGDFDVRAEASEAGDEGGDGLALLFGIDHEDHGQIERGGEVSGGAGAVGGAVEEAHHAFDDQQIGADRVVVGQGAEPVRRHGPGVEVDRLGAGGAGQMGAVDVIGPGLGGGDGETAPAEGGEEARASPASCRSPSGGPR